MAAALFFIIANERQMRRERVFRDRTMQLDTLCDEELYARYRMLRTAIFSILELVRTDIEHPTKRSSALSPETQLLITLRYLSKGGFLMEVGDLHGVSESSVSRCFHNTVVALCNRLPRITFPDDNVQTQIKQEFFKLAGFPRVIGAIDGTLVPIKRPCKSDEAAYVCRKGYHALNVQAVCDANLRFTNVVAKWPGSSHDSIILTSSLLGEEFESRNPDGWLLGDSGYACRPWLLTPLHDPKTRPEEKYNTAHIKTRNTIERAFGVLKSRFRCLHKSTGCLQFTPTKCARITMAAFLLHNYCVALKLPEPEALDEEAHDEDVPFDHSVIQGGQQVRRSIIDKVFS